jgi:hypothetical protein
VLAAHKQVRDAVTAHASERHPTDWFIPGHTPK